MNVDRKVNLIAMRSLVLAVVATQGGGVGGHTLEELASRAPAFELPSLNNPRATIRAGLKRIALEAHTDPAGLPGNSPPLASLLLRKWEELILCFLDSRSVFFAEVAQPGIALKPVALESGVAAAAQLSFHFKFVRKRRRGTEGGYCGNL